MAKHWAHTDEWYCWMAIKDNATHKHVRKSYRDHYAEIPQELWERLKKAQEELSKLQEEIEPYAGKG